MLNKRRLNVLQNIPETLSIVVYRGPSALNGAPIVAILTGLGRRGSHNTKTGDMAQLWIMPAEVAPHDAQKTGDDESVCGDCPQRPILGGKCYVRTFQGPRAAWEKMRDQAPDLARAVEAVKASGRRVRLGAYGDPAALPKSVIHALADAAVGVTGYTHQWREPRFAYLKGRVMASVESARDMSVAHAEGWRTFRVLPREQVFADLASDEIFCPATSAGLTCKQCRLCDGSKGYLAETRKSIAIVEH